MLIWETHSAILAQLVKMNVVNPLKMISVANAIMDGMFRTHFMNHDIFFYFIIVYTEWISIFKYVLYSRFGDGKNCLPNGIPQRVNGVVGGSMNSVSIVEQSLHCYVVTADGRTYTAISRYDR